MVGQKQRALKKCAEMLRRSLRREWHAILLALPVDITFMLRQGTRRARKEIHFCRLRCLHVVETLFDFNILALESA